MTLQQSPPHNEPLGKPAGTVRAYLAMAIVAGFEVAHIGGAGLLFWTGHIPEAMALAGALAIEASAVLGYYFGVRSDGNGTVHQYLLPSDESGEPSVTTAIGFQVPQGEDGDDASARR